MHNTRYKFQLVLCVGFVFVWCGWFTTNSPTISAADDKITIQEILNRHIAALGGQERIQKTTTRVATGKVQFVPGKGSSLPAMSGKATFSSKLPNKVVMAFDFSGQGILRGFDGSQAWMRPMPPSTDGVLIRTLKGLLSSGCMLHDISVFDTLLTPGQGEIKYKGTKKINDRETYQVEIKRSDLSAKLYIDTVTFLRVKTMVSFVYDPGGSGSGVGAVPGSGASGGGTFSGVSSSGGFGGGALSAVTLEFETDDFRDVNGVKLPFRYKEVLPSHTIQVVIDKYDENVDLNDSIFR
ncbi:MAG: hypothetical protein K1Y36_12130 [Blastocatellia bacterium]|nr:hypothetical protein [Blastocatellia bacterium]